MPVHHDALEKAAEVKAIIQREYAEPLTIGDLASRVASNKSTLNLAFREITGMSLKRYINCFRIEKAKELLTTTHMPIDKIAGKVGLHRTNLEKHFRKQTGSTPKEYRALYR